MAGENAKHELYGRLFGFSLLPLALNLLFIIPEAVAESKAVSNEFVWRFCYTKGFFDRVDLKTGLVASMITCGSFSYIIAYVALYPNVKNALLCKKGRRL